jgi:hypothetical protein
MTKQKAYNGMKGMSIVLLSMILTFTLGYGTESIVMTLMKF